MIIQFLLYDRMTALDAIGPYESLSRLNDVEVRMVGLEKGIVRTDTGFLGLSADYDLDDAGPCDVLVVPGGDQWAVIKDERTLAWLRQQHKTTQITASVCTGSLVLAAAGIITEGEISSHWAVADFIPKLGLAYSGKRITRQGRIITAAGVSAGIDMGLALCEILQDRETAEAIQLGLEYDPEPPFTPTPDAPTKSRAIELIS